MKIDSYISNINAIIIDKITNACNVQSLAVEFNGRCSLMHVQNEQARGLSQMLVRDVDNSKVTINTEFKAQIFHVANSGDFSNAINSGSVQLSNATYKIKCIVLSQDQSFLDTVLGVFANGISDVKLDNFNMDSERIISNEFKINVSNNKNYPPNMRALLINYRIVNVEL